LFGEPLPPGASFSLGKPCFSRRASLLRTTTVVDADSGNNVIGVEARAVLMHPERIAVQLPACILLVLEGELYLLAGPQRYLERHFQRRGSTPGRGMLTAEAPGTLSLRSGDPPST